MPAKPQAPALGRDVIDILPEPALITAGGWAGGGADILHVNDRFCALTGYSAAELEGHNTRRLHGPRTDATLLRLGPAAPAREGSGEGWLYRKTGPEFFAQWNYRPLSAGPDGPLVVVYHDHSESWRQREALLRSQKLDTIGLLASGVAHDFNNLLSIINGYCEIMEPKLAGHAAGKDLREIHQAGLKATAIARQILEFSRRPEAETVVINYNTLIREIAGIIRRVCGEQVTLELRLASDLGNARINPTHFQQVLLNLCFNARDAMPEGGRLTIRTYNHSAADQPGRGEAAAPPGPHIVLEVADEGGGIDPEERTRIFEPFYTTKPQGSGLGLSIAQRIVRQAHGQLLLTSKPGAGTRFMLYLPETAEPEQVSAAVPGPLPATRGTEAVLVIEREEALRRMIAGILGLDGYKVTEAANATEAERLEGCPQLVIADTATDAGRQWLQRLRASNPPLMLVSTAAEPPAWPEDAGRTLLHLPKPFALSSLLQEVRRLLDAKGR